MFGIVNVFAMCACALTTDVSRFDATISTGGQTGTEQVRVDALAAGASHLAGAANPRRYAQTHTACASVGDHCVHDNRQKTVNSIHFKLPAALPRRDQPIIQQLSLNIP
jgi:hypothetical protein